MVKTSGLLIFIVLGCAFFLMTPISDATFYVSGITICDPLNDPNCTGWKLIEADFPETKEMQQKAKMMEQEVEASQPTIISLFQNYPNPFNATTTISYQLSDPGEVRLEIYNIAGQLVETPVDSHQEAGHNHITWDSWNLSSGVYFCKLTAGDLTQIRRMTLLR